MIRKTVYSILFICLFALIGFSQTGGERPTPTPRPTPVKPPRRPPVSPTPTKTPRPTPTPIVNPTPVKTPQPPPLPPSAKILWTDNATRERIPNVAQSRRERR